VVSLWSSRIQDEERRKFSDSIAVCWLALFHHPGRRQRHDRWAEQRDAQHLDKSQSLGFATLSTNLQNFNMRNQPSLPRWASLALSANLQNSNIRN
jgi:hypothetical protein